VACRSSGPDLAPWTDIRWSFVICNLKSRLCRLLIYASIESNRLFFERLNMISFVYDLYNLMFRSILFFAKYFPSFGNAISYAHIQWWTVQFRLSMSHSSISRFLWGEVMQGPRLSMVCNTAQTFCNS
jgi:hypothetical protein